MADEMDDPLAQTAYDAYWKDWGELGWKQRINAVLLAVRPLIEASEREACAKVVGRSPEPPPSS